MDLKLSGTTLIDKCLEYGKEADQDYDKWLEKRKSNWEPLWNEWWRHFMNKFYEDQDAEGTKYQGEGQAGRSRIFIGITKNKVNSISNKVKDFLFAGQDPPFELQPTPESPMPQEIARERVKKMQKTIKDQLIEGDYEAQWTTAMLLCVIFGFVVGKGNIISRQETFFRPYLPLGGMVFKPLMEKFWKIFEKWGRFKQETIKKEIPQVEAWDPYLFVIDPKARTPQEGKGAFFDQFLGKHELSQLKKHPAYFPDLIDKVLEKDEPENNEYGGKLRDKDLGVGEGWEMPGYQVSEYWGLIKKEWFRELGMDIKTEDDSDFVEGSLTLANDGEAKHLIRLYENHQETPYRSRRPIFRAVYEEIPLAFYGRGAPESLTGEQKALNSTMRLFIDNKGYRANPPIFYDEDYGEDLPKCYALGEMYGFRGLNGQWDRVFKMMEFPDVGDSLISLIKILRDFSDEETVPKYSTGYGDEKTHRTLGGLSMIMGTANINIKSFAKYFDLQWIEPIIKFYYAFNMAYDPDESKKGDFFCKPTGVKSLMAKEVYLGKFLEFLRILGGSVITPLLQNDMELLLKLFGMLCEGMDLDQIKQLAEDRLEKMEMMKKNSGPVPGAGSKVINLPPGGPGGPLPAVPGGPPAAGPNRVKGMPQEGNLPIPTA